MRVWLSRFLILVGVLALGGTSGWGEELPGDCGAFVEGVRRLDGEQALRDGRTKAGITYAVEQGGAWGWTERFTRSSRAGRVAAFTRVFACRDEGLTLEEVRAHEDYEPSESYSPPLLWLAWPLQAGTQWQWAGTYRTELDGDGSRLPAEATGRIVGWETVTLPEGEVQALKIELRVEIRGRTEHSVQTLTRWVQFTPLQREVRWRSVDEDAGVLDFTLGAAAAEVALPTVEPAGQQKIFIIDSRGRGIEKL